MNNAHHEPVPEFVLDIMEELALFYDIDIDELYKLINPAEDRRVTVRDIDTLVAWILERSGKPWAALEFSSQLNLRQVGMLGPLIYSCSTVGVAIELFHRFHSLLHPYVDAITECRGQTLAIKVPHPPELVVRRWYAEIVLGSLPYWVERLVGQEYRFHEVWFRQPKPEYFEKYVEHFNCNVLFDQPYDCLWTDSSFLDLKIKTSAPVFNSKVVRDAEAELQDSLSFMRKIKDYVKLRLPHDCSIEDIAKYFLCSTRTLQRKLAEEGTSIRKLKQEVKQQQSFHFLLDRRLTVEQVALMLGYEQSASFCVAFRGWVNCTPAEWRTKYRSPAPAAKIAYPSFA